MAIYPGNKELLGQTKNTSGKFKPGEPRFLVMHYTASEHGAAEYLFGPHSPESSVQFVVEQNGDVKQLIDSEYITWHAGKSFWRGVSMLNSHAIGIEIENYGYWRPGIKPATAPEAREAGWVEAVHKNGGPKLLWEPYPEAQIVAALDLAQWILKTHPTIREIVGHDDIAPQRKTDPGPAFPMHRFQDLIHPDVGTSPVPAEATADDVATVREVHYYKVAAKTLNLRGGAGVGFEILRGLKSGTKVQIIQDKGEWAFIEVQPDPGSKTKKTLRGWVSSQFITPV